MRRRGTSTAWWLGNDRKPDQNISHNPDQHRIVVWNERHVLLACITFRLVNALLVRTYFNPDEHWQATEVAHRIVFGYGHLTWEWSRGLRTYLHPLIFAALYKILATLGIDVPWLMIRSPRLLQSLFAAFGNYYLFKLTKEFFSEHAAHWALFCQMVNWFTFYCIVRTLSNCLETTLTILALFYWPIGRHDSANAGLFSVTKRQLAIALAVLSCAIRPTSAIIWLYIGLINFLKTCDKLQFVLMEVFPIGSFILGVSTAVDRWMYGKWTFVPLNFVRFNFLAGGGDFYGTHPWHWYFSQGFPAMALSFLPFSIIGIWWSKRWQLAGLIGWVLSVYSFLGHKEFRFVLPALPLAMMFAGYSLAVLEEPLVSSLSIRQVGPFSILHGSKKQIWHTIIVMGLLLTNIPVALYMSLVHQRGSEAVMEYLAKEATQGHVKSVIFLMPCHSTPYYSFLHQDIPMHFLDCSPSDEVGYVDEADRFMNDPVGFLFTMFQDPSMLPSHIVLFDCLEDRVNPFFETNGYDQIRKFSHAHIPVDRELQGNVLVYSRTFRV